MQPTQTIGFCKSADGTRIAFAECGAGPPLVWIQYFVHHLEFDWDSPVWRPWLSLLSRRHRLVRFDFRGCGLSDRDGVQFTLESLLDDLDAVVAASGADRFILFGMAGGASMATMYAARQAGRVERLILYGGQSRGRLARVQHSMQEEEAATRLRAIEFGWPNQDSAFGQFFTRLHTPEASIDQFRSYDQLLRQTTTASNVKGLLGAFWRADLREFVPLVRCPTLAFHARGDALIPFEEGRSVAASISGARFVPLESNNHVLLEQEPAWAVFRAALEAFLPVAAKSGIALIDALTTREREVLGVVAQGAGNSAIAARLGISEKTVRNHVSIIFSKLAVTSRAQAIVLARDHGLGTERGG